MGNKTKIGCKRKEPKRYFLKRSKINHRSKKRMIEEPEYNKLSARLKALAGYKSELPPNKAPVGFDWLENHHIQGRDGKLYLNPFNMIIVLKSEHDDIGKHNTFERKQELLNYIRPIRIAQGFKLEDYV